MIEVIGPAPSPDRDARVVARCSCGTEWVIRRKHLKSQTSCGCSRKAYDARRRAAAEERKRAPKVDVPAIAVRFVPASHWRTDTAVVGAILIALRLPFDELSLLEPIDADLLRELAGLDADDLDRPGLRRWLEADALGRVYGVRCAASDVFGTPREAVEGKRAA